MLLKKLEARAKNTIHREKQVKAGAVFPDFSAFDRTQHRTPKINSANASDQYTRKLQGIKKGQAYRLRLVPRSDPYWRFLEPIP